jgi:PKD domain
MIAPRDGAGVIQPSIATIRSSAPPTAHQATLLAGCAGKSAMKTERSEYAMCPSAARRDCLRLPSIIVGRGRHHFFEVLHRRFHSTHAAEKEAVGDPGRNDSAADDRRDEHGVLPLRDYNFSTAGNYSVTLTVTDNSGGTNSVTQTVVVGAPPANQNPVADFTISCVPRNPNVGKRRHVQRDVVERRRPDCIGPGGFVDTSSDPVVLRGGALGGAD